MRPSILLILSLALSGASASWFGSDPPPYDAWSTKELKKWLKEHDISAPDTYSQSQLQDLVKSNWNSASTWTYDQYAAAQKHFADIRDSTFDAWDESRLREFLLEQGVIEPKGTREQLVLLAKQKYRAYNDAASRYSAQASTAVYGSTSDQMTKSVSSAVAQATREVAKALDDSKDYVYSTWDDNRLRSYLTEKGVDAKLTANKTRAELLAMMRDTYAKVANPVWHAWSDSYIRAWLVSHGVLEESEPKATSEKLREQMAQYYYNVNDAAWSTWSDSDLKAWLVEHNIIKSDAQIQREKLTKLIEDNYANAQSTLWSAWSDSQIREWLIEHGHKAEGTRDDMIKTMNAKYQQTKPVPYLTWPDARLRAYLREHGVSEAALPTSRPGLLQETRIRWVQTSNFIQSTIRAGVEKAEEVWNVLTGKANEGYEEGKDQASKAYASGKQKAYEGKENVKARAGGEL